jgi:multicomponent Na+:H+ antiporter subunit E
MGAVLWNVILALIWVAATGVISFANLAAGFLLGAVILVFTRRVAGAPGYLSRIWQVIRLFLYFLWELVLSNLRVAYEVLTPGLHFRPGIIAIPMEAKTDAEITLLANMITLTPGSLSLDISQDRKTLYLYIMDIKDVEEARRSIKEGFERRLLAVTRGSTTEMREGNDGDR